MRKSNRTLIALLVVALAALACGTPSGTPPSSPDDLATIVASTLNALTPAASTDVPSPTDEPGLLPHSLYYLAQDGSAHTQVFRLEQDGRTTTQITSEPMDVGSFDVHPVDGSVAYVSNNQLLLINADTTGRRILVDGGPVDPNNPILNSLNNPRFSPNGQVVAYGQGGLNLYDLTAGTSTRVLETIGTDPFTGLPAPSVLYFPEKYSPDGNKLLVTTAIPNSDGISAGIFYPATRALVQISGAEPSSVCCGGPNWAGDGSALFAANASVGMFGSGLWRVDAATGSSVTLLPMEAGGGNINLADEPYLAPDGQLYYFYALVAASPEGFIDRGPLQIVRSGPDGVTGRAILRPETFENLSQALWAPDASFVLVMLVPPGSFGSGRVDLIYLDGRPNVVLIPNANSLTWGP